MKTLVIKTRNENQLVKLYAGQGIILYWYRDNNGKFLKEATAQEFDWLAGETKNIETRNENFLLWDRRETCEWSWDESLEMDFGYRGEVLHGEIPVSVYDGADTFIVSGSVICLYSDPVTHFDLMAYKRRRSAEQESEDVLSSNKNFWLKKHNWKLIKSKGKRKIVIRKFSDK